MRNIFLAVLLILAGRTATAGEIAGSQVEGRWSDYAGNNYQCPPDCPGGSSGSSPSYSGYSGYSGYDRLGEAVSQALSNWAEMQSRYSQGYTLTSYGDKAAGQGNIEQAIAYYEQALGYLPDNKAILEKLNRARAGLLNKQGKQYHEQGDWAHAIAAYQQALGYHPNSRDIRQNLRLAEKGQSYEQIRQKEGAAKQQMAGASRTIQASAAQIAGDLQPSSASPGLAAAGGDFKIKPMEKKLPLEWSVPRHSRPDSGPGTIAYNEKGKFAKSSDEVMSAKGHGMAARGMGDEAAVEELGKVFDYQGKRGQESLPVLGIESEGMGMRELHIPQDRQSDPDMKNLAQEWVRIDRTHRAVQQTLNGLEGKADKTPEDFVKIANLRQEITHIESKKFVMISKAEDSKKKTDEKPQPAADSKPKEPPVPEPVPRKEVVRIWD